MSNCSQRRQLGRHTQDSSLCTAQLRVKTERTQQLSPLALQTLSRAVARRAFQEIDTLINAHHVQRGVDLSRSLIALCKEGMRYYHTYHRLPFKVAVTAGFVGWLACVLVAIPSKNFLDKIPAQDLDELAQDYAGQVMAKILPNIWQDLSLLPRSWHPRSCSSWQESFPRTFCWVLEEKWPGLCRRVGANSGGVGHCSPKMVLVQVVAIVMVLWYQSSPIQYYWYYALPLVCWSYVWVRRSAFRAAWQGMATNRVLLLKGTVHLVGVVVGLEALVMSFFYREVLSAVLVVVSILQSVFGMYE